MSEKTASDTSDPVSVIEKVKSASRAHHVEVERKLQLMRPQLGLAEYRELLELMLGFYEPAETRLSEALSGRTKEALSLHERRKTPALRLDLSTLESELGETHPLPPCARAPLPTLNGDAELLGLMYVMEGATLGGQFLSKHLAASLPEAAREALAFYRGYGAQTGARWKDFQAWVLSEVTTPEDQARYCDAATRSFAAFNDWFDRWSGAQKR